MSVEDSVLTAAADVIDELTPAYLNEQVDRHLEALRAAQARVLEVPEGDFRGMTAAVEGVQAVIAAWDRGVVL